MPANLVIVESPAKAKTIEKYLGKDFHVLSSVGHIRKDTKVDVDNDFAVTYEVDPGHTKVVSELKKAAKSAKTIWLATDEDREGESISWHLIEVLKLPKDTRRITFHEITKPALEAAIQHPRTVDMDMVSSQQARQTLDMLVGYDLSGVVRRKVPGAISAGRVQSPALRLIVEREKEIEAFGEKFNFKVTGDFLANAGREGRVGANTLLEGRPQVTTASSKVARGEGTSSLSRATAGDVPEGEDKRGFPVTTGRANAVRDEGIASATSAHSSAETTFPATLEKLLPATEPAATKLLSALSGRQFRVSSVVKTDGLKKGPVPFATAALQIEANSRLGFSSGTTMRAAQGLYQAGHITYHRTDSLNLSNQALASIAAYIEKTYGKNYLKVRKFKTKSAGAQEAHEAIRPTNIDLEVAGSNDYERRLYHLIRTRTLATQMAEAKVAKTTISLQPVQADGTPVANPLTPDEISTPDTKKSTPVTASADAPVNSVNTSVGASVASAAPDPSVTTDAPDAPVAPVAPVAPEENTLSSNYTTDSAKSQDFSAQISADSPKNPKKLSKIPLVFTAKGEIVIFDGFLKVYGKSKDTELPDLAEGDLVDYATITARQTFAKPPARYTEGSLVKKLEELGIGRPSTYASIMSAIQARGYVVKGESEGTPRTVVQLTLERNEGESRRASANALLEGRPQVTTEDKRGFPVTTGEADAVREKGVSASSPAFARSAPHRDLVTEKSGATKGKLVPTPVGELVSGFLTENFHQIVDYGFTAGIEEQLDLIAEHKLARVKMLRDFYTPFADLVGASAMLNRYNNATELGKDPKTGKPIYAKIGKNGGFIQLGDNEKESGEKPRFAPLPEGGNVKTVTLEQALAQLALPALPRSLGTARDGTELIAAGGPFGPYLKAGKYNIPLKGEDPYTVSLATAEKFYDEKKASIIADWDTIMIINGAYGPYIKGPGRRNNLKIPKDIDPKSLSKEDAIKMLEEKGKSATATKGKTAAKSKTSAKTKTTRRATHTQTRRATKTAVATRAARKTAAKTTRKTATKSKTTSKSPKK